MRRRRAPPERRDPNEAEIVDALKAIGCTVERLNVPGKAGIPDLLVGWRGINALFEVKREPVRGELAPSHNGVRLKPEQVKWHDEWRGQVAVVRTPEEAVQAMTSIVMEAIS